jgi:tRNA 2-thiouridine synthesizing protein A
MSDDIKRTFDASGLMCPMPIIKAKKEIQLVELGEVLEIIADDEGAYEDFPAWCDQTGNELIKREKVGDKYRFLIRRKI